MNRFGKYELVARLARGGMAETYRAQMQGAAGVTKQVVIKKVLPHLAEHEQFIEAFVNEARISATFSHGNIAQVFDFGRVEGDYFIAMEWVDGRSLAQVLDRAVERGFQKLPAPVAVYIASELLKGLHYAHTRVGADGAPLQVVHRDVSPENVLVSYEGHVKVVDFGVAKAVLRGRTETEPGLVKGKFHYFSPEQAMAAPVDARTDVFAAGIVLYRMLCGRLPFEGQMHLAMRNTIDGVYPRPLVVNPALPPELAEIIVRALQGNRDDRFATALQMQQALAAWLHRHDPAFSEETVKDWMTWLFQPELERDGRPGEISGRFSTQLEQWKTAPARRIEPLATGAPPEAPPPARVPVAAWVGGGAVLAAAIGFVVIASMEGEPYAPPQSAMRATPLAPSPAPAPASDVVAFPGVARVSGAKHRLRVEQLVLPEVTQVRERTSNVREEGAPGLDPLFAVLRSGTAETDGQVGLVLRSGTLGLAPFTRLKVFDFQPFGLSPPPVLRSLRVGAEARHFKSTEAQVDARSGGWVTVTGVTGRAKLTLAPTDAKLWAGRPRKPSVVVAWQRIPGELPDADWHGGVNRAVLASDAPLVVEGATSFAFAFADGFATTDADSVQVAVEAAPEGLAVSRRSPPPFVPTVAQIDELVAVNHPRLLPCFTVLVWEGEDTAVFIAATVARGKVTGLTLNPPKQRKATLAKCLQTELDAWGFPSVEAPRAINLHYSAKAQNFDPLPEGARVSASSTAELEALSLARVHLREKNLVAAHDELERCLTFNPENAECHLQLANCYARMGDRPQAALHYQTFVQLAPPNTPEVKFAKQILADYGKPAE